jgi:hypothetical protein
MDNRQKEEYLRILNDIKRVSATWDWDEDYYESGKETADERMEWAELKIDEMIELIKSI